MELDQKEWDEYKRKVKETHEFLFDEGLDGRTAEHDMRLIRLLVHRFSSAKFFVGMIVGFLTIGIPAIYGLAKLFELIRTLLKG